MGSTLSIPTSPGQPSDSDLTAIAALSTTSFGRALLALADAAALRTAGGLGTASTHAHTDYDASGAAAAAQSASQPLDSDLTAIAALSTTSFGRSFLTLADAAAALTLTGAVPKSTMPVELVIAVGDESTAITTGTAKVTFRAPWAFTVTAVRASVNTVSSSGIPTVDINEAGTTILSTKLTIDASEFSSTTAATPAVISDSAIADDAEITIDVDVAGTGAKGLKVIIYGTRVVA